MQNFCKIKRRDPKVDSSGFAFEPDRKLIARFVHRRAAQRVTPASGRDSATAATAALQRRPAEAKPRNAHSTSTPLSHPTVTNCISYFEQCAVRELLVKQGTAQHNTTKHNKTTEQQNSKTQQNTTQRNTAHHSTTKTHQLSRSEPTELYRVNRTELNARQVGSGRVEERRRGRRIGCSKNSRCCANIER